MTAINSFIAVATSVLHGLGPVVMSNERSASDPNLIWIGHEINHQWSKSIEAEGLLRAAIAGQAGLADSYFSLLRRSPNCTSPTSSRGSPATPRWRRAAIGRSASWSANAGAATATSAGSSSWPSRPSWTSARWCPCSTRTCSTILTRFPGTGRSWAWPTTSRSSVWARPKSAWWRWTCCGSVRSGSSVVLRRLEGDVPDGMWPTAEAVSRVLNDDQSGFVLPAYRRALDNVASGRERLPDRSLTARRPRRMGYDCGS